MGLALWELIGCLAPWRVGCGGGPAGEGIEECAALGPRFILGSGVDGSGLSDLSNRLFRVVLWL